MRRSTTLIFQCALSGKYCADIITSKKYDDEKRNNYIDLPSLLRHIVCTGSNERPDAYMEYR